MSWNDKVEKAGGVIVSTDDTHEGKQYDFTSKWNDKDAVDLFVESNAGLINKTDIDYNNLTCFFSVRS